MSFSLGPRLDLRHSQSLVMTPQLRQAIKLLQSSNLEVVAFVEEELERNPLLERDETESAPAPEPEAAVPPVDFPSATADVHIDLHDTQNLYEATELPGVRLRG